MTSNVMDHHLLLHFLHGFLPLCSLPMHLQLSQARHFGKHQTNPLQSAKNLFSRGRQSGRDGLNGEPARYGNRPPDNGRY